MVADDPVVSVVLAVADEETEVEVAVEESVVDAIAEVLAEVVVSVFVAVALVVEAAATVHDFSSRTTASPSGPVIGVRVITQV